MLTFYNYKEPLKEIPAGEGYGYYGALLGTPSGDKVQCHICGELYSELSAHVNMAHKINHTQYKEKFQLAYRTALLSEEQRMIRKEKALKFFTSMTVDERMEYQRKAAEGYQKYWRKFKEGKIRRKNQPPGITLETKNKRGTCPDQLLDRIKEVASKIGKTPTKDNFIDYYGSARYISLIYKTFGSWSNGLTMAGYSRKTWRKLQKGTKKPRYQEEDLLEYLRIFYQENGKVPTETDCRRGLIPDSKIYCRKFGSFPKARELAGINDDVGHGGWQK